MGLTKNILIISILVPLVPILIQEFLFHRIISDLNAIEEFSEKTKFNFDKNLIKEEKFEIKYDQDEWDYLIQKLNNTRYFKPLKDSKKFDFGFNIDYAKELIDYWKNGFDWKKQVNILNKYSHYRVKHNDITLHYIRVNEENKSETSIRRVPLLLLSGWPGSFYEFYKAIDSIKNNYDNKERYFDIIVPSIPGYDYSEPLNQKYNVIDTARLYDGLMRHLFGEELKYFVHGEDWGSLIATAMGQMYAKHIAGVHITMAGFIYPLDLKFISKMVMTELFPSIMLTDAEKESNIDYSLKKRLATMLRETGYMHLQATRPDTVGMGLTDSPAGLMAYILEKYSVWSFNWENEIIGNHDGALGKFSKDDLLTIVTIYWMTNTITSSMRYYKCSLPPKSDWFLYDLSKYPTPSSLPVAVTFALNELDHTPYSVLQHVYPNLVQYKILKSGGHFGLFHNPTELIPHLVNFIDSVNIE